MKKRLRFRSLLALFLVVFAGAVVWAGIVHFHPRSPEQMKADIRSQIPIGSFRPKVEEFMKAQDIEEGGFDYVMGDPRQGTLIKGYFPSSYISPRLALFTAWKRYAHGLLPKVYVVFYFDHKGPDGKLISYQVSDKSIPVPSQ